jgi:hypothetical protein
VEFKTYPHISSGLLPGGKIIPWSLKKEKKIREKMVKFGIKNLTASHVQDCQFAK